MTVEQELFIADIFENGIVPISKRLSTFVYRLLTNWVNMGIHLIIRIFINLIIYNVRGFTFETSHNRLREHR
jgi:hypothetical protein